MPTSKNSFRFSRLSLILIVSLVFAASAGYVWVSKQVSTNAPKSLLNKNLTLSTLSSTADTGNWKTFTYPDNSFSFKYPPSWYTVYDPAFSNPPDFMGHFSFFATGTQAEYSAGDSGGNEILQIFLATDNKLTLSDFERMDKGVQNSVVKKYYVDSMPAVEGVFQGQTRFSIVLPSNKTMEIISDTQEGRNYIEDIVSTLKFTK